MAVSFDQAFGIHEHAMKLRTQRAEVLARNLANADTPNFKAQDIDFKNVLRQVKESRDGGIDMARTNSKHINTSGSGFTLDGINVELKYRQPQQPSMDGNTVETEQELARFARNAGDFQASMTILNGKIRGMMGAIRGE
ncbi:MAG: flagellar basal body rod protein FlgB [Pseudomonadales bacterium]